MSPDGSETVVVQIDERVVDGNGLCSLLAEELPLRDVTDVGQAGIFEPPIRLKGELEVSIDAE